MLVERIRKAAQHNTEPRLTHYGHVFRKSKREKKQNVGIACGALSGAFITFYSAGLELRVTSALPQTALVLKTYRVHTGLSYRSLCDFSKTLYYFAIVRHRQRTAALLSTPSTPSTPTTTRNNNTKLVDVAV